MDGCETAQARPRRETAAAARHRTDVAAVQPGACISATAEQAAGNKSATAGHMAKAFARAYRTGGGLEGAGGGGLYVCMNDYCVATDSWCMSDACGRTLVAMHARVLASS